VVIRGDKNEEGVNNIWIIKRNLKKNSGKKFSELLTRCLSIFWELKKFLEKILEKFLLKIWGEGVVKKHGARCACMRFPKSYCNKKELKKSENEVSVSIFWGFKNGWKKVFV
jgi:hypothetical protein